MLSRLLDYVYLFNQRWHFPSKCFDLRIAFQFNLKGVTQNLVVVSLQIRKV